MSWPWDVSAQRLDQNVCFLYKWTLMYSAVLRNVNRVRRCAHPGENSAETRHPFNASWFRSSQDSVNPRLSRRQFHQSWTNIRGILLMSFSSVGFVYVGLSSDDNFLKLRLWMCLMDCFIFISLLWGALVYLLLVLLQLVWRSVTFQHSRSANLNRKHFKLDLKWIRLPFMDKKSGLERG